MAKVMEKPSRKEREYRARREEILKAAERVFAEKGFHSSTVAEIAKEAEFAIGTLYQFFQNKEDLYYTMMIEKFDLLYSTLRTEVNKSKKCVEKLKLLVEAMFSFVEENVDFFKIFSMELNVLKPSMENKLREQLILKHFAYIKLMSDVIKEGMREGIFKKGNPDDYSSTLSGMMNIFSFNWILNQQKDALKAKATFIINLFLHGVCQQG
jgi:AcrR family transcriptional regulator